MRRSPESLAIRLGLFLLLLWPLGPLQTRESPGEPSAAAGPEALARQDLAVTELGWELWLQAQGLSRGRSRLTPGDLDEAMSLFSRARVVTDAKTGDVRAHVTGSRAYRAAAFLDAAAVNPVLADPSSPILLSHDELEQARRSPRLAALLAAVPAAAPAGALTTELTPEARERLGSLMAVFDLALARQAASIAVAERRASVSPADVSLASRMLFSGDSVDGWSSGRDYLPRAYAEILSHVYLQRVEQERTNGRPDAGRQREIASSIAGLDLAPEVPERLRALLARIARAIWQDAQAGVSTRERVLLLESEVYRAVEDRLPYEEDPHGEVRFFPRGGRALEVQGFDVEAFGETGLSWQVLADLLQREGLSGAPADRPGSLVPLDFHAADELVDLLSRYGVLLLTQAAADVRAAGSGRLLPRDLDAVHERLAGRREAATPPAQPAAGSASGGWNGPVPVFTEVTAEAGLQPIVNPLEVDGEETAGPPVMAHDAFRGAATADFNGDGRPDLFIAEERGHSRLYLNTGDGRFRDATPRSGLAGIPRVSSAYAADYDNDGCVDLLIVRTYLPSLLWHNRCDATFEDVTRPSGLSLAGRATTGAVWFDYDGDGNLDLYLLRTGDFERGFLPSRGDFQNAEPNQLWHNRGDGTFVEVTAQAGVGDRGLTLAAAMTDFDDDGDPDLYVVNDMQLNVLYENLGGGRFRNVARQAGVDDLGNGMGVSVGDVNQDGRMDLYLTNVGDGPARSRPTPGQQQTGEVQTNRLYINQGGGRFSDQHSALVGDIATGWGWDGFFFDFDNDGRLDLYVINGFRPEYLEHHRERKLLFHWDPGARRYRDVSSLSGVDIAEISRAGVYLDYDGDGDLDLLLTGLHSPRLFRNASQRLGHHWLAVRLVGRGSNRDGIGAKVKLVAGGQTQYAEMGNQGGGFDSSILGDLHFGLGVAPEVEQLEIRWPSGRTQLLSHVRADQRLVITEPDSGLPRSARPDRKRGGHEKD